MGRGPTLSADHWGKVFQSGNVTKEYYQPVKGKLDRSKSRGFGSGNTTSSRSWMVPPECYLHRSSISLILDFRFGPVVPRHILLHQ